MQHYNIVLIGAGNVATHLGIHLQNAGHNILQVFSKHIDNAEVLASLLNTSCTNKLSEIDTNADLYILAVKDYAIDDVILELRLPDKIVVHTSGAVPLLGMEHISKKCGVFYPFQTFTKDTVVDFTTIPIFIEASDKTTEKILLEVAQSLSKLSQIVKSDQRKALHLAAVYVNNFTNHLFHIAQTILQKEKLPFELLYPLIKETVTKAGKNNPYDIQTGPARRDDWKTIDEHLHFLEDSPEFREVYLVLTESIMAAYRK